MRSRTGRCALTGNPLRKLCCPSTVTHSGRRSCSASLSTFTCTVGASWQVLAEASVAPITCASSRRRPWLYRSSPMECLPDFSCMERSCARLQFFLCSHRFWKLRPFHFLAFAFSCSCNERDPPLACVQVETEVKLSATSHLVGPTQAVTLAKNAPAMARDAP